MLGVYSGYVSDTSFVLPNVDGPMKVRLVWGMSVGGETGDVVWQQIDDNGNDNDNSSCVA